MRISIEGVVSQLMNQAFKSAVGRRRGADLTPKCKGSNPLHSNASHMKVAQKPRGIARFRRYELVSVCGIWQWRCHSCLLSPRAFFGVSFLVPYWVRLSPALWKVRRIQPLSSRLNSLKKRQNPAGTPRCRPSERTLHGCGETPRIQAVGFRRSRAIAMRTKYFSTPQLFKPDSHGKRSASDVSQDRDRFGCDCGFQRGTDRERGSPCLRTYGLGWPRRRGRGRYRPDTRA
jgi:hypothetical protein